MNWNDPLLLGVLAIIVCAVINLRVRRARQKREAADAYLAALNRQFQKWSDASWDWHDRIIAYYASGRDKLEPMAGEVETEQTRALAVLTRKVEAMPSYRGRNTEGPIGILDQDEQDRRNREANRFMTAVMDKAGITVESTAAEVLAVAAGGTVAIRRWYDEKTHSFAQKIDRDITGQFELPAAGSAP